MREERDWWVRECLWLLEPEPEGRGHECTTRVWDGWIRCDEYFFIFYKSPTLQAAAPDSIWYFFWHIATVQKGKQVRVSHPQKRMGTILALTLVLFKLLMWVVFFISKISLVKEMYFRCLCGIYIYIYSICFFTQNKLWFHWIFSSPPINTSEIII